MHAQYLVYLKIIFDALVQKLRLHENYGGFLPKFCRIIHTKGRNMHKNYTLSRKCQFVFRNANTAQRTKHVIETNSNVDPAESGWGVGMTDGQEADQPVLSSLFCSFSHFNKGSKYSTRGLALISLCPVMASMASCHCLDDPIISISLL